MISAKAIVPLKVAPVFLASARGLRRGVDEILILAGAALIVAAIALVSIVAAIALLGLLLIAIGLGRMKRGRR